MVKLEGNFCLILSDTLFMDVFKKIIGIWCLAGTTQD